MRPAEPNPARATTYAPSLDADGNPVVTVDGAGVQTTCENGESTPLLNSLLGNSIGSSGREFARLDDFLAARTIRHALEIWLGSVNASDRSHIARRLSFAISTIDDLLTVQINAILHHPSFQKLESSWRGLEYLCNCMEANRATMDQPETLQIKVLNMSWRELDRDFQRALEFDQSSLFQKVYEREFGTSGGHPFGMLIGDYEIHPRPSEDHPHDDIALLSNIAGVAAASFCPFITGVHPSMFGLDEFTGLERIEFLEAGFNQTDFIKWRAFRDTEDSRFVGLALPRVLMRRPYQERALQQSGFVFRESVEGPNRANYLWGNAAFAFGEVVMRSYAQSGWLATTRGVERNVESGGIVTALPTLSFHTDSQGVAVKSSTEFMITDHDDSQLGQLGFLPLCHCPDTEFSAFYTNFSAHKPKKYDELVPTQNARMSGMLHYVLCASRFAHYLKVIARRKIGSSREGTELERELDNWIKKFVTPDDTAAFEVKARRPLRDAQVSLRADPRKPGSFLCTFHLLPHYQLDDLSTSMQLRTNLEPPQENSPR
jgi:type VI secretion system ImpC/EvpB family protein